MRISQVWIVGKRPVCYWNSLKGLVVLSQKTNWRKPHALKGQNNLIVPGFAPSLPLKTQFVKWTTHIVRTWLVRALMSSSVAACFFIRASCCGLKSDCNTVKYKPPHFWETSSICGFRSVRTCLCMRGMQTVSLSLSSPSRVSPCERVQTHPWDETWVRRGSMQLSRRFCLCWDFCTRALNTRAPLMKPASVLLKDAVINGWKLIRWFNSNWSVTWKRGRVRVFCRADGADCGKAQSLTEIHRVWILTSWQRNESRARWVIIDHTWMTCSLKTVPEQWAGLTCGERLRHFTPWLKTEGRGLL